MAKFKDIRNEASKAKAELIKTGASVTPPNFRFWFFAQARMVHAFVKNLAARKFFRCLMQESVHFDRVEDAGTRKVAFVPDGVADCCLCGMPISDPVLHSGYRLCDQHEEKTRLMVNIPVPA